MRPRVTSHCVISNVTLYPSCDEWRCCQPQVLLTPPDVCRMSTCFGSTENEVRAYELPISEISFIICYFQFLIAKKIMWENKITFLYVGACGEVWWGYLIWVDQSVLCTSYCPPIMPRVGCKNSQALCCLELTVRILSSTATDQQVTCGYCKARNNSWLSGFGTMSPWHQ